VGGTTSGSSVTLKGGALNAFGGASAVSILAGSVLDVGGFDQTIGSLSGGGTVTNGGASGTNKLTIGGGTATTFSGTITDGSTASIALAISNSGTSLTLSGANTYSGGTTISGGMLQLSGAGTMGATTGTTTVTGGILDLGGTTQTQAAVNIAGGTLQNGSLNAPISSSGGTINGIGGSASLTTTAGTTTVEGINTYTGATTIAAGTLALSGTGSIASSAVTDHGTFSIAGLTNGGTSVASLAGNGSLVLGANSLTLSNASGIFSGSIGGTGGLTLTTGTETLSGANTYTGATNVNGGVLDVEGAITGTSAVTVNAGGTLTGTGIVDPPIVTIASGAALVPGNGTPGTSMTIEGNLAFQSGAIYLVQVNPSTASFAAVTGTATLGGATVNAVFANGGYISKTYTILTASGGVSGTFASTVVNTNLPTNFHTTLSYDANDAFLNLVLNFAIPGGLNGNQQAVANGLSNFFNSNGSIPLVYGALSPGALTQASGELGTSAQQTTFDAMSQFTGLLTGPFMQRSGGPGSGGGTPGFAEEEGASGYAARQRSDAFAMFTKAPPRSFEQRWGVWAAGFGGSQTTDGNAALGSNNTTSRVYGTAVGADYRFSPFTLAGFALAGGGTNFSVANGGTGRSDLFQAGAYIRHTVGPAYIAAALAYGWQDITTDRIVTIAGVDRLRAEFNANAWSGRIEGGYRFVTPWIGGIGLTPYAAGQFTTFDLPAYAESVLAGTSNFALAYGSKSVTDTRSELGVRTDKSFALQSAVLTLRSRFAWAHDFNPDRNIAATFQALPGASFVVNGAAQAHDSSLTTASVEMKWMNGWSAAVTFEGEFSDVTRSYAGKGIARYAW
jgi:autotransporter-associated beta strand protein